jgi:hypothetical protein
VVCGRINAEKGVGLARDCLIVSGHIFIIPSRRGLKRMTPREKLTSPISALYFHLKEGHT